jgi:hypothetical protein
MVFFETGHKHFKNGLTLEMEKRSHECLLNTTMLFPVDPNAVCHP